MADRLFDKPPRQRRPRWTGREDIEPRPLDVCPDCDGPLRTEQKADALALFWMHGFGAVVRTTYRTCPCGYRRHWHTQTISPLR